MYCEDLQFRLLLDNKPTFNVSKMSRWPSMRSSSGKAPRPMRRSFGRRPSRKLCSQTWTTTPSTSSGELWLVSWPQYSPLIGPDVEYCGQVSCDWLMALILTSDWLSVRANTRKGYGPWSTQSSFRTDRNIVRAPLNVKAMATSDSSVQVTTTHKLWYRVATANPFVKKLKIKGVKKSRCIFTLS